MQKLVTKRQDSLGMTLVEVLTAMLILGIIIVAIFPLINQSLQATNLSHSVSSKLFGEQEFVEIVAVTEEGAVLADGTFISVKQFPVFGDGNITWVLGRTVKKDDLVRFLASNQITSFGLFEVYEGYTSSEGSFTIADKSITDDSELAITDLGNNGIFGIDSDSEKRRITFSLPTDGNRLTNSGSPYKITVTTGGGEKSGILLVHLPRAVIAKDNGGLLVASSPNPAAWFQDGSNHMVSRTSSAANINKIISVGISEAEACFIAIGKDNDNNGKIYAWENGDQNAFKEIASYSGKPLNDIISTSLGLFIVGNGGTILQSSDGKTWTEKTSGTSENLNAISYTDNKFVVVGDNGIMLISSNGSIWNKVNTSEYPCTGKIKINGMNTVTFDPGGDYLKTDSNPVTGSNYTIFMVVKPSSIPTNVSFLTLGSENNYFSLGTNDAANLEAKIKKDSTTTYNYPDPTNDSLALATGAYIIACRVEGTKITLYKNGSPISGTIPASVTLNGGEMQFGNNPLTSSPPMPFNGSIAEVLVFNSSLKTNRDWYKPFIGSGYYLAPAMDIVQKYLSVKYNIGLPEEINTLHYNGTASKPVLSGMDATWRSSTRWPYGNDDDHGNYTMKPAIWLDIWSYGSDNTLDQNGNRVSKWKHTTHKGGFWGDVENTLDNTTYAHSEANPYPIANSLRAVAGSDSTHFYAGGNRRNLLLYNGTSVSQDTAKLNGSTETAIKYKIDDMVYAHDRFIALLNDEQSTGNKYIATLDRPSNYADVKEETSNNLNDIFHYTPSNTLLVVGNNGAIYYSGNGTSWTNKSLSGNLVAGCMR